MSVIALDTITTISKPFSMECNVIVAEGIIGSVDILWSANGRVIRTVNYTRTVKHSNSVYRDILNITRLQLSHNNTVYYCNATVTTSIILNGSANYTLQIGKQLHYNYVWYIIILIQHAPVLYLWLHVSL